jgi:hypothetical protein
VTTSASTGQPDRNWEDLLAETVRVLTAAGRLIRPPLLPTAAVEQSADPAPTRDSRGRRVDWAEFVSLALAGAAANLGGIEAALAGRPGSWEAGHVRTLLHSTIGDHATQLLRHRTEPVTLTVYVAELLVDLGVWTAFESAQAELSRQAQTVAHSTPPNEASADREPNRRQQEQQADELDALHDRLWELYERDAAAYGAALKANIEATAAALPDLPRPSRRQR